MILSFLDAKELCLMGLTSKHFHLLASDNSLWENLCQRQGIQDTWIEIEENEVEWKEIFKEWRMTDGPVVFPAEMSFKRTKFNSENRLKISVLGAGGVGKVGSVLEIPF